MSCELGQGGRTPNGDLPARNSAPEATLLFRYDAPMTPTATVPLQARLVLAHAAVQKVADIVEADILHIKGYALDPILRYEGRRGTDVDVLVRPAHVDALLRALGDSGWSPYSTFEAGSPFEHAQTLHHEVWGYVDVHRHFPGITLDRGTAFETLWSEHKETDMGGFQCAVPSLRGQVLLLVLHVARLGTAQRGRWDLAAAWEDASPDLRGDVLELVAVLGAEVAFAAAIGNLDHFRDRPDYLLWKVQSQGGTRIQEWRARVAAAPTPAAKARIILRAPLVNVHHLEVTLGHPPTHLEVVREFFARPVRGLREEVRRWRGRRR